MNIEELIFNYSINLPDVHSQHFLSKTQDCIRKIFFDKQEKNDINDCFYQIRGSNRLFDKLIETVNENNRLEYCKVLFHYCEMSQDWRQVGFWLEREIIDFESSRQGKISNAAWLYFAYGRYLEESGKLTQAAQRHLQGIDESEKYNDRLSLGLNKLGMGITMQRFDEKKDVRQASCYLIEAIDLFENNPYQKANGLMNLGSCYDRLGEFDKAIESYLKCISILESLGNQFDLGRAFYSLGIAYIHKNELDNSDNAFSKGIEKCISSENLYFLAQNHYGFGWLEYKRGKFKESQKFLETAITEFNAYKSDCFGTGLSSFFENEGNIYLMASASYCKVEPVETEIVEYYLGRAKTAYQQIEHNDNKLNQVLANRARLYEAQKKWKAASGLFFELLVKGGARGDRKLVLNASKHLLDIAIRSRLFLRS
jgi:tetratricopeptide (TPR) repeat protein